jgi:site-specific DNA-methyltransferase (adenine-specific)
MIEDYTNKIIQGDCLSLLRSLPDESVDITFADPPFNLGKKYGSYRDNVKMEEYLEWCRKWISEMVRVTKPTGSIFVHNVPQWLTYYAHFLNQLADFKHWISWDAPTAPMGKSLQPAHYGILYYAKEAKQNKFYEIRYPHKRCRKCGYLLKDYGGKKESLHPFGPLVSDVWTDIHRIKHDKYRDEHPCQLPVHLLERVILMSTDENDIVLDPFVGTGTTAIAAKRVGRRYIGFDVDPTYVDTATAKLKKESAGSKMETVWVSFFSNEVITIRHIDWDALALFYEVPSPANKIDYAKIEIKGKRRGIRTCICSNVNALKKDPDKTQEQLLFSSK